MMVERDEPHRITSHQPIGEELHLNHGEGTHYRYKNPRTRGEKMAIFEIQAGPGRDGMCSVLNVAPIDSDSSETYDEEFSRLIPLNPCVIPSRKV